jgi:hypothetical protein
MRTPVRVSILSTLIAATAGLLTAGTAAADSTYTVTSRTTVVHAGESTTLTAYCSPGDRPLGGQANYGEDPRNSVSLVSLGRGEIDFQNHDGEFDLATGDDGRIGVQAQFWAADTKPVLVVRLQLRCEPAPTPV